MDKQVQDYRGRIIDVVIDFAWETHPSERKHGKPDARAMGRVAKSGCPEYPINSSVLVERWPGDEYPYKLTGLRTSLRREVF